MMMLKLKQSFKEKKSDHLKKTYTRST